MNAEEKMERAARIVGLVLVSIIVFIIFMLGHVARKLFGA